MLVQKTGMTEPVQAIYVEVEGLASANYCIRAINKSSIPYLSIK